MTGIALARPEDCSKPRWLVRADAVLGWITEIPAAVLVVAEILVLLSGVIARYAFQQPLIWTDELASLLFLWLAVLGSVIALRRGAHMRLTTVTGLMSPERRAWFDALSASIGCVFVLLILAPTQAYVEDERLITLPSLGISAAFRVGALQVGSVLMLAVILVRMACDCRARQVLEALLLLGLVTSALMLAKPWLLAIGNWNLVIFFVLGVGSCVLAGVPIAFAFGIATVGFIGFITQAPLTVFVSRMDEGMSHLILLSVPLFVFLGALIEMTGMARAMVNFLASLLGHVRGGLSYVLLGAMYLVSGISGSKAADMAAVAPVLFPEMKKRGSKPGELVALLAASGAMSETIPPSLVLITIGSVTGVSIAALFTGGLLPALVLACALAIVARFRSPRDNKPFIEASSWGTVGWTLIIAAPALALPFLIRAAVVEGIATATEVSTIGIVYSLIAGVVIYRSLDWRRIYPALVQTASLTGAILLIIGAATSMAWALTQSGFSRDLATAMTSMPGGPIGFMAVSIVVFVILGSILEGIPAIVLFGPLLFPAARAIGIHEVHYAMVVILAMGIGLFAPPFGVGYYTACAIGKVPADEGMRAIWVYITALIAGLIIVAAVPWISIGFLP